MPEIKEVKDKELREIDLLTETVGELTAALEGMNEALLVILYNLDLKIPDWKDRLDIEQEVGPKIEACQEAVRRIYAKDTTSNQS